MERDVSWATSSLPSGGPVRAYVLPALIALASLCGCTPTRVVHLPPPGSDAFPGLRAREAVVVLPSGAERRVRGLDVRPDSTTGSAGYPPYPFAVATADLSRVSTRSRALGTLQGGVRGLALGMIGGFVVGFASDLIGDGGRDRGYLDMTAAESGGFTGFLSGLAGGACGMVWGYFRGGKREYVFRPTAPAEADGPRARVPGCPVPALVLLAPDRWDCDEQGRPSGLAASADPSGGPVAR